MAVVNTQQLLTNMSQLSKKQSKEKVKAIQREAICSPLKEIFPNVSQEQLHYELLRNGLFDPYEGIDLEKTVSELEEQKVWQTVAAEYERLRALWKGPDSPVYIYPLTNYRPTVDGMEVKKNGVTYNGVLFLFVSAQLVETELKTLFAHEYHHICRLAFLNKAPKEMMLIDSLIIEGMAECTMEELYGERWLSPWTKRYSFDQAMAIWKKHFVPVLHLKSVKNHRTYLYGNKSGGLPDWIGYCIGYHLVKSYLKNVGPVKQDILYKKPTDEVLARSEFRV